MRETGRGRQKVSHVLTESLNPLPEYALPAKIDETLRPLVISVEGGEVSGR